MKNEKKNNCLYDITNERRKAKLIDSENLKRISSSNWKKKKTCFIFFMQLIYFSNNQNKKFSYSKRIFCFSCSTWWKCFSFDIKSFLFYSIFSIALRKKHSFVFYWLNSFEDLFVLLKKKILLIKIFENNN